MSRAILSAWHATQFAPGSYPERRDATDNRLDRWLSGALGRMQGMARRVRLRRLARFAARAEAHAPALREEADSALHARVDRLRAAIPREGLTEPLVAECFALVREVCARRRGLSHFTVQLMGGYAMLQGYLAEMPTGEGKTITAALPAVAAALGRLPVHVITVNEYLARRDAETLGPVYEFFGLTVGVIQPGQQPAARRAAYECDVAYCVNKDLVFDYLRDRIAARGGLLGARQLVARLIGGTAGTSAGVLRGLCFAIVDEADSVLIDEARTPLIISDSGDAGAERELYERALAIAAAMTSGEHYRLLPRERVVELTEIGKALAAERCPELEGLWAASRARHELIEQAIAAQRLYARDTHYIVHEGKVQIVDEYTGRVMADRSWERGLHQMIEVKEAVELSARRQTLARVTYQRFFRRYLRLCGMTGTAAEVAGEMRAVYGLDVLRIPTNRPMICRDLGVRLYGSAEQRWEAVVEAARTMHAQGRPVLIGTRSVGASEAIAAKLEAAGLAHAVLNARQDAQEAAIIAQAGQPGRITVATNMAGRGTDIQLEAGVAQSGGLHVILTEFHESRRIDRQLFGRAGRQGDPGSYEAIAALDDELFRVYAGRLSRWLGGAVDAPLALWKARLLRWLAQSEAERQHSRMRRQTLQHDRQLERTLAFSGRKE